MQDQDDDTTIGRGGWGLVVASGLIVLVVLRYGFHYLLFPSVAFALAVALIVLLILYRLAVAVNRHDDAEAERPVRRIVPASALSEGTTRVSGIEGAQASPIVAVPVRPDPATPVPQRPAATVTPLARVESAPIILPRQASVAEPPAARPVPAVETVPAAAPAKAPAPPVPSPPAPEAKPAAKAKAAPKPEVKPEGKPAPRSGAGGKSPAKTAAKAAGSMPVAAPATTRSAGGFKGKAELEAMAGAGTGPAPVPKAAPAPAAEPAAKPKTTKAKAKASAGARPKAAKAAATGLVRLTAPRGGKADDLKLIDGVGPALERLVNSLGFYHFDQIAAWTEADVALVDAEMKSFKGRATRDKWVLQAKILANGGTKEEAAAAAKA